MPDDMAVHPGDKLTGLALCAGGGNLELGLRLALGDRYRGACYVEWDSYCAASLVARMAESTLEPAPIWDDLSTFDGASWRGAIDLISAGFPCQPWSLAGEQKGTDDERWLWPDIAKIIRDVGPSYVLLENVPAITLGRGGFDEVLGTLASLGFDAEWEVLSASAVGAPQVRDRVWVLGWRRGCDLPPLGYAEVLAKWAGLPEGEPPTVGEGRPDDPSGSVADADSSRRPVEGSEPVDEAHVESPNDFDLFPPPPGALGTWREILRRNPTLEPALRGVADGLSPELVERLHDGRTDRIRLLGNAVVPQVAAAAFISLARRGGLT